MAKKSLRAKQKRIMDSYLAYKDGTGAKPKHITKMYNRCQVCGRAHGYMREFGICRVCFRHFARKGLIVGIKKASW